jgi:hypothetical protein
MQPIFPQPGPSSANKGNKVVLFSHLAIINPHLAQQKF